MNEKESIKKALSCLHASDGTLQEVMKMADKQKSKHITGKIVAVALAACLVFALAVTAAAYSKGAFDSEEDVNISRFFEIAFGKGVEGQEAHDVQWRDADGSLLKTEHYPNIDRVETDPELAEKLLGPYIRDVNKVLSFNGYTLHFYNSVMDENGIGLLYFEVENPDGIGLDKYAARLSEDTPLALCVDLCDADGQMLDLRCMAESDSFSDTRAVYVAYATPFHPFDGRPLTLTFRWYGEDEGEYSIQIDTSSLVPSKRFSTESVDVEVSPLGMMVNRDISGSEESIVIRYADGSSYTVKDDAHENSVGSIIEDSAVVYAFNRLVPVDNIVSVEVELTDLNN